MARLDERLHAELERVAQPGDPGGVYERLIRRHERRRVMHRLRVAALVVVVVAGSSAGIVALSRLIGPRAEETLRPVAPSPSTNGDLVYTDGERIVVSAADGSHERSIPAPGPGLAWHVAWSPDGARLAVALFGDQERSLWVMDVDGSNPVMVALAENVSRPSWHPDGEHLTYSTESAGVTEIRITGADGSDDRVVYSEAAPGTYAVFSSTFSPDGSRIVFDAGTDVGYDIFVMDADGSHVEPLTRSGTDYNPAWSPDGSEIVFTRQEAASESDIFVMDADGSNTRRLTHDGSAFTNLDAQFSPDGELVTYEAAKHGGTGPIKVMHADGSDPTILVPGQVLGFSWQPVPAGASSVTPTPAPSDAPDDDLGLGFPVCSVSSIQGRFASPDAIATLLVATRALDVGGCPPPEDASNVVALDTDRDGRADTSYGPIECTLECRAFAAPDVDGDGTDEALVVQDGGAVVGLRLYDIVATGGRPAIVPVTVADPGDPKGMLVPGEQASFLLGGDEFELYALRCEEITLPWGLGLVATSAEALPHDSADAEWHAHQTTSVLRNDGLLHVLDVRDFTEPVSGGPDGPSFASGETLCGSNLGPVVPIP